MAYGDIIIKDELRPCIVTTPEEYKKRCKLTSGNALNLLNYERVKVRDAEVHNALFHRWHEKYRTIGESPMAGGCAAGQISELCGIVEYEDGTIHKVDSSCIRFIDRKTEEYIFDDRNKTE